MLTHRNMLFQTQAYFADIDKLGAAAMRSCIAAPLSHGSGLYGLPHFAAGAVNVIPESGGFDAGGDLRRCSSTGAACSFFAAPTMLVRLLAEPGGAHAARA